MNNEAKVQEIEKLDVHAQVKDVKVSGEEETQRVLVTKVSFEYEGLPGVFDDMLTTQANGHRIDVAFSSPQAMLDDLRQRRENGEV